MTMKSTETCQVLAAVLLLSFATATVARKAQAQATTTLGPVTAIELRNDQRDYVDFLGQEAQLATVESESCLLNRVVAVFARKDGGVTVVNAGARQVCVFDSAGEVSAVHGRAGAGPGEYQSILLARRFYNDSLLMYDDALRRFTVVDVLGRYGRTVVVRPPPGLSGVVTAATITRDGNIVVGFSDFTVGPPGPTSVEFSQSLAVYSPDGRMLRRLPSVFASEHFIQPIPQEFGGVAYWNRAFGRRASVVSLGEKILVGDAVGMSLVAFDQTDDKVEKWTATGLPSPLTDELRSRYIARELARATPTRRPIEKARLEEMPYPRYLPMYSSIQASGESELWFEPYAAEREPAPPVPPWRVWDMRYRVQYQVRVPSGFKPMDVGLDRVCGVSRDEDGLEQVLCYRIARR